MYQNFHLAGNITFIAISRPPAPQERAENIP